MTAQQNLLFSAFSAIFSNDYLASVLLVGTFLMFTVIGVIFARRSGVFFLAAEGVLVFSATAGYFANAAVRAALLGGAAEGTDAYAAALGRANALGWMAGLLCGLAGGMAFTLVFCWFLLRVKSNVLLTSFALNIFASASAGVLVHLVNRGDGAVSSAVAAALPSLKLSALSELPALGGLLGNTGWFTYLALLLPLAAFYLLNRTGFGLRLRAAEENHIALTATGLSASRTQLYGMLFAGAAVSLGGVTLVMAGPAPVFSALPQGEGYLALAAVWACDGRLWKSSIAVLLLALVGALTHVLQGLPLPISLIQALLYAAALAGLLLHSHNDKHRHKVSLRAQRRIVEGKETVKKKKRRAGRPEKKK